MRHSTDKLEDFCMWTFLQPGGCKSNVPLLKEAVRTWVKMVKQKTAGQRGGKDISYDDIERIKMTILLEAAALVLSGETDKLGTEEKQCGTDLTTSGV